MGEVGERAAEPGGGVIAEQVPNSRADKSHHPIRTDDDDDIPDAAEHGAQSGPTPLGRPLPAQPERGQAAQAAGKDNQQDQVMAALAGPEIGEHACCGLLENRRITGRLLARRESGELRRATA